MLREATGIRKIYLRAGRTDLRKGIYSLQAMIQMHNPGSLSVSQTAMGEL